LKLKLGGLTTHRSGECSVLLSLSFLQFPKVKDKEECKILGICKLSARVTEINGAEKGHSHFTG